MWSLLLFAGIGAVALYEYYRSVSPVTAGGGPPICGIDYPDASGSGDCMPCCCGITSDPSTWPTGDNVWLVCRAIAIAEGADVEGSVPDRLNNPGDLSKGDEHGQEVSGYETLPDGENAIEFASKTAGWQALYTKINNIRLGISLSFSPSWSWTQIGAKYAGNSAAWTANVTRNLGVNPTDPFSRFFA